MASQRKSSIADCTRVAKKTAAFPSLARKTKYLKQPSTMPPLSMVIRIPRNYGSSYGLC